MLQATLIGHLGADAECKNKNGKEFITFRIANTEKWTDNAEQVHENTTWVDCIMNGKPKVFDYLKKGVQLFVAGSVSLRVYSSEKERCYKAGMTINVRNIELLGGRTDEVPSVLYTEKDKQEVKVAKYFYSPNPTTGTKHPKDIMLVSKSGEKFYQDPEGWIHRRKQTTE